MSDSNIPSIQNSALGLLVRREYSRQELSRKLIAKFPSDSEAITIVLDNLAEQNLQSDVRFAESYTRFRVNKGFGKERISMELREKGVSDRDIMDAFEEVHPDWLNIAISVHRKKFKVPPKTMEERAKQQRFLQYRGFSFDIIQSVFDH